jgi:hypothetical protein
MKPTKKSHIDFCRAVADGMTYKDAYKAQVADKEGISEGGAEAAGSKLAKKYAEHIIILKQRVSAAIDTAHEQSAVKTALKSVLSKAERMQKLSGFADDDKINIQDRIKAISELNKMDGSYAPIKKELQQLDENGNPTGPGTNTVVYIGKK